MAETPLVELIGAGKVFRAAPCRGEGLAAALLARRLPESETITALDAIDFRLFPGEIVGVIGANGAGKSTLLKLVARILSPTSGEVRVRGRITPLLSLEAGFVDDLSGRENLRLYGRAVGWPEERLAAVIEEALEFAALPGRFADLPVRLYSTGMRARLVFAAATRFDPDILLVDEVLTVGDADFQEKSFARLRDLVARASGALITSHALTQLRRICTRLLLLDRGKIVRDGPCDEVIAWLETASAADAAARARYDVFRTPEELAEDALADLLSRAATRIPEQALPPMRFDAALPLDLALDFPSSLLPFTRHALRVTDGGAVATARVMSPPAELSSALAASLDLASLRAGAVPVLFSLALTPSPPFEPLRTLPHHPLPGDRLELGPGTARSTVPALRLCARYGFPRERAWATRFSLYRFFPEPLDLTPFRSVELSLRHAGAPLDLALALRDDAGISVYSQAKRVPGGERETRIVFPLDGGFVPAERLAALRGRVRGFELIVYPGDADGEVEITVPEFFGLDTTGAMVRDLEPAATLPAGEIARVGVCLAPPPPPPMDVDERFRVALGHHTLGKHGEALAGFLSLLGRVENAEVHAFASRALERLGRDEEALAAALHAIALCAAGRGGPVDDRVAFALAGLERADAPLARLALTFAERERDAHERG